MAVDPNNKYRAEDGKLDGEFAGYEDRAQQDAWSERRKQRFNAYWKRQAAAVGGMAGAGESPLENFVPDEFKGAAESPDLMRTRDAISGQASEFRKNLSKFKEDEFGSVAGAGREQLKDTLGTIKTSSNQRGLLFSGMRAGAEQGARQKMATTLAGQKAEINREAEALATDNDEIAANVGLEGYGSAVQRADEDYALQKEAAARRRAALGQIGEGVGYGFGAYYGNARDSKSTEQPVTTFRNVKSKESIG